MPPGLFSARVENPSCAAPDAPPPGEGCGVAIANPLEVDS